MFQPKYLPLYCSTLLPLFFFMSLAFAEYSIKGADFERRFISNIEYIKRKLSKDTFQHKQH